MDPDLTASPDEERALGDAASLLKESSGEWGAVDFEALTSSHPSIVLSRATVGWTPPTGEVPRRRVASTRTRTPRRRKPLPLRAVAVVALLGSAFGGLVAWWVLGP